MKTKECNTCSKVKSINEFYKNKNSFMAQCKSCYNKKRSQNRKQNISIKARHYDNMQSVKKSYGLTEKDLQDLMNNQSGLCAVCKIDLSIAIVQTKTRLGDIDHDHITGKVRGLVCRSCNLIIGHIENNKEKSLNTAIQNSGARITNFMHYLESQA